MDEVYAKDFLRAGTLVALANRLAAFELSLEAATVEGGLGPKLVAGLTALGPVAENELPGIALIPWQAFLQRCLGVDVLTPEAIATCRERIAALGEQQCLALVDIVAEVTGLVANEARAAEQRAASDRADIDRAARTLRAGDWL